ncbi:MAG: hypothetical protein IJZ11_03115 [Bacteroidaceae bacterium]|nr:hypothetical protein [Bacteroidaceae bacterium]
MKSIKVFSSVLLLGVFVLLSLCCASSSTATAPTGKDAAEMPIENVNVNIDNVKS